MLVKMSVENFKSFDESCEMTMISSSKIQGQAYHKTKIKNTNILKYGVVYGANASGKSNLVDFFHLVKTCVCKGIPLEAVDWYCKNKEENKYKESVFEIQFTIGTVFYAYGFSAILSERKIKSEWLYELYQDGSAKLLFEHEVNKQPRLNETLKITTTEKRKFHVYAEDFEENDTLLFLTEMNRGKKLLDDSKLHFFQKVYQWITNNLYVIRPNTKLIDLEYYYDDSTLDIINQIIKTFDTGISNVSIKSLGFEEFENNIPKVLFHEIMNYVQTKLDQSFMKKTQITLRSDKSFFNIQAEINKEPIVSTVSLKHGKSYYDFRFEDESDGTRRLFDLIDMLLNERDDVVYIVDELERSLHPKLTQHFLRMCMNFHTDKKKQLLFTTHEAAIMDQSLFRRDEIWFVERNEQNSSVIYSLDRFKERYDKVLSKAYLEGRYGAIPVFSTFHFDKED